MLSPNRNPLVSRNLLAIHILALSYIHYVTITIHVDMLLHPIFPGYLHQRCCIFYTPPTSAVAAS